MLEAPTLSFNETDLYSLLRHPSRIPTGDTFAIFDPALSDETRSDFSSLGFFKVAPDETAGPATGATPPLSLWVLEVILAHWGELEMPFQIAQCLHTYQPSTTFLEKAGFWKTFEAAIQMEAKKCGDNPYLHFFRASNRRGAKVSRIADFHRLIQADRVRFADGDYINMLFDQATSFTPLKPWKKDDGLDVCGMAALHFEGQLVVS
jgi:hypothetical protein